MKKFFPANFAEMNGSIDKEETLFSGRLQENDAGSALAHPAGCMFPLCRFNPEELQSFLEH